MEDSELEKLWEGTLLLGSLKKMVLRGSKYLKEIPDLSLAINLEEVDIYNCKMLESFPTHLNLESLVYLDLTFCQNLRNFPVIKMENSTSSPHGIEIRVEDCIWNTNLPGLDYLACLVRCMPCEFRPNYLVSLIVRGNEMLEKLWEGAQSLESLVTMDLSECGNLTEIPDLSMATNLVNLKLNNCKSLVTIPSTIENLQKLVRLEMKECTRLEVLPTDVNLSSLEILDLSGCSSLRTFPLISTSIEELNLDDTAIEEVPCCIENFSRLTNLFMHGCQRLRNISPNIFGLTRLEGVGFTDCGGVVTALRDATVMGTMEDHFSCIPTDEEYFTFLNWFELDVVLRELILRSYFKPTVLLGREVPKYFTHRAYGDSLTVTLPQSSLSQELLRFKACVVVDPLTKGKDWYPFLEVNVGFNGTQYWGSIFKIEELQLCKRNGYLFSCSFKFQTENLPSKLAFNDVEFKFSYSRRIKECGVRLLNVSPYPDDSDGSSDKEYNQQSGENGDVVVETGRSKRPMRMTSGTSEEYINLPCGQIVVDTGLTALNMEHWLGEGEASSVSSYPSMEGEALCVYSIITEQQDAEIPTLNRIISCHHDDGEFSENQNQFNSPTSEPESVCNFFFI